MAKAQVLRAVLSAAWALCFGLAGQSAPQAAPATVSVEMNYLSQSMLSPLCSEAPCVYELPRRRAWSTPATRS